MNILNKDHSIASHFMYEMRHKSIQNDRSKFRYNLKRLGEYMAFEISKSLEYKEETVETPLGLAKVNLLKNQPVVIGILRAALPFYNGFIDIFDQADGGFVGAYREEGEDIEIQLDYLAVPNLDNRVVILTDPMLATGKSLVKTVNKLLAYGKPAHIHVAAAIAAPEGIDYISDCLNIDYTVWVYALDDKLDTRSYIIPGLGDAGDLSYGEKI
ncbi:uracil phosphoribosyltransferase [Fulvivirga sp. RKSG066]|nr:uracil phosphoribosyltransferase [Fulvivirga aurantia]